jgi:hypothetical protein
MPKMVGVTYHLFHILKMVGYSYHFWHGGMKNEVTQLYRYHIDGYRAHQYDTDIIE